MSDQQKTAAVIVIGNEILSGRTQDTNLSFIGQRLDKLGIILSEARVIPDNTNIIVQVVKSYSKIFDYVFTTGGIGPTHDDITTASVAKAFDKKLIRDPDAVAMMDNYYEPGKLTDARLKMADVPEGAILVNNCVSGAPGYQIENVFVLAGVPNIMRAMFDELESRLISGPPVLSASISTNLGESQMSAELADIQSRCKTVSIGSYPYFKNGKLGVNIVLRSIDTTELADIQDQVAKMIVVLGGKVLDSTVPDISNH